MTIQSGIQAREVVPWWRSFGAAVRSRELLPLRTSADRVPLRAGVREPMDAFNRDPGPYTAGDVMGHLIVAGTDDGRAVAAKELLLSSSQAEPRRRLSERMLAPRGQQTMDDCPDPELDPERTKRRISLLRELLTREPRNAIRWADLARAYAEFGQKVKARRAILTAAELAPNDRFVVRTATRAFVHLGEPDTAHDLLLKSDLLLHDPWLLAAEVAVSSILDTAPREIRRSRRIVERREVAPWHLSELASALATIEWRAGARKRARKLMLQATEEPTDNALAQAESVAKDGLIEIAPEQMARRRAFEARARYFARAGDAEKAAKYGMLWLAEQPFDTDPAGFTSYVAAAGIEDFELSLQAAEAGLRANPNYALLLNNAAYALINLGRLAEARKYLDRASGVSSDSDDRAVLLATSGMLAFREGDRRAGRKLYDDAIAQLQAPGSEVTVLLATMNLAREEIMMGSVDGLDILRSALRAVEGSKDADVHLAWNRLVSSLDALSVRLGDS